MNHLPHLAQRVLNVPVAIHPAKAEVILAALADRFGIGAVFSLPGHAAARPMAMDDDDIHWSTSATPRKGYDVECGVACINVQGTLVHRNGGQLRPSSGMTGYDGIRANLVAALHDPAVRGIAFIIDSPGGEVSGMFDLAETIREAGAVKPCLAVLEDMACSAAYALASACGTVVIPESGVAGSVGVIAMHADFSRALDKEGVRVTLVTHGARKGDGNPYQPLEGEALTTLQADIDTLGLMFSEKVARFRGLTPAAVEGWQAGTFLGQAAVAAGLADKMMPADVALAAFAESIA